METEAASISFLQNPCFHRRWTQIILRHNRTCAWFPTPKFEGGKDPILRLRIRSFRLPLPHDVGQQGLQISTSGWATTQELMAPAHFPVRKGETRDWERFAQETVPRIAAKRAKLTTPHRSTIIVRSRWLRAKRSANRLAQSPRHPVIDEFEHRASVVGRRSVCIHD